MYQLTEEQQNFINSTGNIVLHACPGSGKTFVVARKLISYITNWKQAHQGVAVLSFTNVASDEISKQTTGLLYNESIEYPHYVGTLDSFINTFILLRFGHLLLGTSQRPMIAFKDLYSLPFKFWRTECYKNGCQENIGEFRWDMNGELFRNNKLVDCPSTGQYGPPCFQYKKMLLRKGLVFQSEVASLAYQVLSKFPEIAKAIARRFPIIILDEAQDTSIEQMAVIDLINQAGVKSIFLVSDPDQSIYEWRNATPECFISKMNSVGWKTLPLTFNYRCSQLICNATQLFAKSLENKLPNTAMGSSSNFAQKPILFLYEGDIKNCRMQVMELYLNVCTENDIAINPENVAIVTRGKINMDTDIEGLWKSNEVEFLAQASYEWFIGSRKKAFDLCEKALFSMFVREYKDIKISIAYDIEEFMSYGLWKQIVIGTLISLPNIELTIENWINQAVAVINDKILEFNLSLLSNKSVKDLIKVKSRDSKVSHFKSIPVKNFFERKNKLNYTLSSIHGVKGETYDALLLFIESKTGKTLTPSFLNTADINQELMRIAYVAMTRPRKVLAVAMPISKSSTSYSRFPQDKWEYIKV